VFNLSQSTVCSAAAWLTFQGIYLLSGSSSLPIALTVSSGVYFLFNTFSISTIIALTESSTVFSVWRNNFYWTAPHYLIGAGVAAFIHLCNRQFGWLYAVLILPVIYLVYTSYQLYLTRLADEKRHVTQMADLHLRTIEALALAIEAKDDTTHGHLRRVQIYAEEIGKELALSKEELQALEAAALLHDIGKLAVPEYIISKPGRLTTDEFEKIKIHPIVGAEILECVNFPYPVVPIVRSHHEKWDGSGYPDGLKAEQIPIGARIISAVDCLDALASDRQYRPALPLDDAMAHVVRESGKSFDPRVVDVLKRRYRVLEQMVKQTGDSTSRLSTRARVERGAAPAAGLEQLRNAVVAPPDPESSFISAIAAARQEFQLLHEVTRDLGNSLSMEETLAMLSQRLRPLIPFDAIAIYQLHEQTLVPQYVFGEDQKKLANLRIPFGQGLSGWVAENKRPIVNGNPAVESGYLQDAATSPNLRSALSVPLEALSGVIGALTLYRNEPSSFTRDHLRLLLAISSKAALTIENSWKYAEVRTKVGTDQLTGLLNTQSLFLELDKELEKCKQNGTVLAVMVLDMNGFKQVNDTLGHMIGNQLLLQSANGLRTHCRQTDHAARMGGDEFAVVLPGITPHAAAEKAHAFCQAIIEAGQTVTGHDLVSASIGTAFFPADGADAEQLLAEADRKMYVAKKEHHEKTRRAACGPAVPHHPPVTVH